MVKKPELNFDMSNTSHCMLCESVIKGHAFSRVGGGQMLLVCAACAGMIDAAKQKRMWNRFLLWAGATVFVFLISLLFVSFFELLGL